LKTVQNKFNHNPLHSSDVMQRNRFYEHSEAVPSERKVHPKFAAVYEEVSKSFRTESITKNARTTINTR